MFRIMTSIISINYAPTTNCLNKCTSQFFFVPLPEDMKCCLYLQINMCKTGNVNDIQNKTA